MARTLVWGLMIAAGLCGLPSCRQHALSSPESAQPGPQPALGGGLQLVTKEQHEEIAAQKVTVKTAHPQLAGGDEARAQVFNQAMSAYVARQIQIFKDDFKEVNEGLQPAELRGGSIEIGYRVLSADSRLISIQFNTSTFTGGAHPNGTSKAFNYDLRRHEMLTLGDLFTPNTNYLPAIAGHCLTALKQRRISDDDLIKEGAGAKAENYENWNIAPEGLLITFDAYQVAAYALGPQEVVIPYSDLRGMIRPEGPLSSRVK